MMHVLDANLPSGDYLVVGKGPSFDLDKAARVYREKCACAIFINEAYIKAQETHRDTFKDAYVVTNDIEAMLNVLSFDPNSSNRIIHPVWPHFGQRGGPDVHHPVTFGLCYDLHTGKTKLFDKPVWYGIATGANVGFVVAKHFGASKVYTSGVDGGQGYAPEFGKAAPADYEMQFKFIPDGLEIVPI